VHSETDLTLGRATRVLAERLRPAVAARRVPFTIEAAELPGEPIPLEQGPALTYHPARVGDAWGPAWGTTWFRLTARVPEEWAGERVEAVIDLGFRTAKPGFQAEALVMDADLAPIKAVNPRNQWVPVVDSATGGEEITFYLEAASNPELLEDHPFLPTRRGDVTTVDRTPLYRLEAMDLAVIDEEVAELAADLDVVLELAGVLADGPRRAQLLQALDDALAGLHLDDIAGTAATTRAVLAPVLAVKASEAAHRLSAVGHSHIDTAWLWPLRETRRKVARTVSSILTLLQRYPEFRYGMSSAQQYAWIKRDHPQIWERIKAAVAEGRFEPLGGMWVESDTVMPSGESMVRQFLHGQRFFEAEFGRRSRGVWLPDSFGYSPALPQLIRRAGFEWFFTQKISWNQVNTFPHHTFDWEGIDGSRILTHFPPMDTYDAELSGVEVERAERQFREARRATGSIAPVGWGDGGGGTTREMIARAARMADLDGAPRVSWESPDDFFERTHAELPHPPVWVGELYLELHRAVTTSQHHTKEGNRRSEHLLVEAEWWATAAWLRAGAAYPYEELEELWRIVLTHQFHDILPGTSIAWVHREARETYAAVIGRLEAIIDGALRALAGEGDVPLLANPTSFPARLADGADEAALVTAGGLGVVPDAAGEGPAARLTREGGKVTLANELVAYTFDASGLLVSAVDLTTGRDYAVPGRPGNLFQLHQDFPNKWDAWDVDRFYRDTVTDLTEAASIEAGQDGVAVQLEIHRRFGDSSLTQTLRLEPGQRHLSVHQRTEWFEREKFLKLAFPLSVWARESLAETQYGFHARPTHTNTSWEAAKFETSMQRWVMVGDRDGAVALANDSSHGYDVTRDVDDAVGVSTTLRLSLLRAPRYPDPETDQGTHEHSYAIGIGMDELAATELGQRLNAPLRRLTGARAVAPLVTVTGEGVLLDAVKPAEDRSGDLVVRVHEAAGHHAAAAIRLDVPFTAVQEVSLLEEEFSAPQPRVVDGAVALGLTPFSVRTLRFTLGE